MNEELKKQNTETRFKRKYLIWFFSFSPFLILTFSIFSDRITERNFETYCYFCLTFAGLIIGSKINDTVQKFKLDTKKDNQ